MPRRKIDDFIHPHERGDQQCDSIETLIKRTVEETIALLTKGIFRELKLIREALDDVRQEIRTIRDKLEMKYTDTQGSPPITRERLKRKRTKTLSSILRKEGFILGSEARIKLGIPISRLQKEAIDEGLLIVELEGDIAVLSEEALEEFKLLLSSIRSPDPEEAARSLGKYMNLFNALRKAGRVFFDSRTGSWRLI